MGGEGHMGAWIGQGLSNHFCRANARTGRKNDLRKWRKSVTTLGVRQRESTWFCWILDENVSPAADQPDSRAVGQPLVTLVWFCTQKPEASGGGRCVSAGWSSDSNWT
eukprot:1160658-Pelagomonas_calceolata.AAC.9